MDREDAEGGDVVSLPRERRIHRWSWFDEPRNPATDLCLQGLKLVGQNPGPVRRLLANRADFACLVLVMVLAFLPCIYYFICLSPHDVTRPWFILYDVPLLSGYFQAASEGDGYPLIPHMVHRLNAPFVANWCDFPTTEELVYAYGGLLTHFFGVITAYNLCILSAHLLAAAGFYVAARIQGSDRVSAVMTGAAFSFSRYLFVRDSIHINLSFCWHLPLYWVVTQWFWEDRPLSRRHWLAIGGLCCLASWQHPYYWFFWMVMLVPCWAVPMILKEWRRARPALIASALSVLMLLLAQVDSFRGWIQWGRSSQAFARTINELQIYGLRLPEFFLPSQHHLKPFDEWAQLHYYKDMAGYGWEMDSSYLGFLGMFAALHLTAVGLARLVRLQPVPFHFGMSMWILAVGVCGGLNMCAGALGLLLFRCTCRFSILLFAGVLLHLALQCTRWGTWQGKRWIALFVILPLVCVDTMPPRRGNQDEIVDYVKNQRATIGFLESKLPASGMVFQWPVHGYPEAPMLHKLPHYEQMVAYLLSKNLRFSYGDCRGRPESQWQYRLSDKDPAAFCRELESYGFSAVWVYRKGMTDDEFKVWEQWKRRPDFLSPLKDHWVYLLHPDAHPRLPELGPCVSYGPSFYPEEHDRRMTWRWAWANSYLRLFTPAHCRYRLHFGLTAFGNPRSFRIKLDGKRLWTVEAPAHYAIYRQVELDLSSLGAGNHRLDILPSGNAPGPVDNGTRMTFQLVNLKLEKLP